MKNGVMVMTGLLAMVVSFGGCGQKGSDDAGAVGEGETSSSVSSAPAPATSNSAVAGPEALPTVPADQLEMHGTWRGEPFWIRLSPYDDQFGGRVVKVVYTPDLESAASLLDLHPWLLVDDHLRLIAWNERSKLSAARFVPATDDDPAMYEVNREVERRVGDDVLPDESYHRVEGHLAWPQEMIPALLALGWSSDQSAAVPIVDIFAEQPAWVGQLTWNGESIVLGEQQWRAVADADGQLQQVLSQQGDVILEVAERFDPMSPEAAHEREQKFLLSLSQQ